MIFSNLSYSVFFYNFIICTQEKTKIFSLYNFYNKFWNLLENQFEKNKNISLLIGMGELVGISMEKIKNDIYEGVKKNYTNKYSFKSIYNLLCNSSVSSKKNDIWNKEKTNQILEDLQRNCPQLLKAFQYLFTTLGLSAISNNENNIEESKTLNNEFIFQTFFNLENFLPIKTEFLWGINKLKEEKIIQDDNLFINNIIQMITPLNSFEDFIEAIILFVIKQYQLENNQIIKKIIKNKKLSKIIHYGMMFMFDNENFSLNKIIHIAGLEEFFNISNLSEKSNKNQIIENDPSIITIKEKKENPITLDKKIELTNDNKQIKEKNIIQKKYKYYIKYIIFFVISCNSVLFVKYIYNYYKKQQNKKQNQLVVIENNSEIYNSLSLPYIDDNAFLMVQ